MWYWAPTSNVMFRRGILDTFEYSSEYEKWRICADRLLYNLVHYIAGSCHINRRLAAYRRHGRNGFYMRKSMGKSTYTPKRMKNLCGSCNMTGHSLFSIFKMTKEKKGSLDNQFLSEFVLFILPALSLFYIVSHISLWFSLLNKGNITTWIGIGILPPRWIWIRIKKLLLKLFGKLS